MAYPTDLDSLVNPTGAQNLSLPDHAQQHSDANDAVEALEAKLGTGASTPDAGLILAGTSPGVSSWQTPSATQPISLWVSANPSATGTTWVDSGFQIDYLAAGELWMFDFFIVFLRTDPGGSMRFRWHPNDAAFTGGFIRSILQMGMTPGSWEDGFYGVADTYDTAYGNVVPDLNNSARLGQWKGTLLIPTTPTSGNIKLQFSSAVAATAVTLSGRSWILYGKL